LTVRQRCEVLKVPIDRRIDLRYFEVLRLAVAPGGVQRGDPTTVI
jgi:hypothetical protein